MPRVPLPPKKKKPAPVAGNTTPCPTCGKPWSAAARKAAGYPVRPKPKEVRLRPDPKECRHPVNRRIGRFCALCGKDKV